MENVIEAKGIARFYGAVTAVEGINFHIGAGEIVGFAGDNGAGKSTLMRIVAGDVPHSKGELLLHGVREEHYSPKIAHVLGIEMVYQDLALCDNLEIYENVFLGLNILNSSYLAWSS